MAGDTERKADYMVMIVDEYADAMGISPKEAFDRLDACGGVDILEECYEIEHTLPISSTIDALDALCKRRGGGDPK